MNDSSTNWLIVTIAVALVAAGAWWYLQRPQEAVLDVPAPTEPEPVAPARTGPLHPIAPLAPADERGELIDLPTLDDSDGYFSLALLDMLGPGLDELLVDSGLIERFVATIDNLPRSHVAEQVRPVHRLATNFRADAIDDEAWVISPENAARYDALVDMLATSDPDQVYATYRRFYPLFQQAYVGLGYPDAYFNDRVVEVIDHLLETPVPGEPPRLVRPHVLYEFADPDLEALSSGQKLLLRIGPGNAEVVKRKLGELRSRIASP